MDNTNEPDIAAMLNSILPKNKTNTNLEEASKLAGEILVKILTKAKDGDINRIEYVLPDELAILGMLATIARG